MKGKLRVVDGDKKPSIFRNLEALRIEPDDDEAEEITQLSRERRKFRQLDESWVKLLFADPRTPSHVRLILVLVAEADFHRHIKINSAIWEVAGLSRWQAYRALEHLKQQGFVSVERPGHGKAPIATPLRLTRRFARK